jgi:hypothetical protein
VSDDLHKKLLWVKTFMDPGDPRASELRVPYNFFHASTVASLKRQRGWSRLNGLSGFGGAHLHLIDTEPQFEAQGSKNGAAQVDYAERFMKK